MRCGGKTAGVLVLVLASLALAPVWQHAAADTFNDGSIETSIKPLPNQIKNQSRSMDWYPLGTNPNDGTSYIVKALTVFNGELIAGGYFTSAGGVPCNYVARWNGAGWSPLGSGMNGGVHALIVHDETLYAGGNFTSAGGVSCNYIAQWNGFAWSPLAAGVTGFVPKVRALAIHNNTLIVGGSFNNASGTTVQNIAAWNGGAWSAVDPTLTVIQEIFALTSYQGNLIAGFYATQIPGYDYIAQWNGATWSSLGTGMGRAVGALAVYNG